jgi:hypothetical protein
MRRRSFHSVSPWRTAVKENSRGGADVTRQRYRSQMPRRFDGGLHFFQ